MQSNSCIGRGLNVYFEWIKHVLQAQSLLEKEQMEQERQNKNVLVTDTKNYVFWKFYW